MFDDANRRVVLGLGLSAIIMLDGSAPRVSFAKESPAKTDHPAALKGKGNTDKKGSIPAGASGKDSDRIDTRITVQPHRPALKPTTIKSLVPGSPRSFRLSRSLPSGGVVRNAIGARVPARENLGGPHFPISVHSPAAGRTGNAVVAPNLKPIVRPTALNSGAINGTTQIRGSVPSSIGGPGRAVAGINGTTIRPKH